MKIRKLFIIIFILLLTCSCTNNSVQENNNLEKVKNGFFAECSYFSIEELVNNYMKNPKWDVEKSNNGYLYNVMGKIYNNNEESKVLIQFIMDKKNNIIIRNLEIDNDSENKTEKTLISDMCKTSERKKWLKDQDDKLKNIPAGYQVYYIDVDLNSTFANNIFPDSYVNLFSKETKKYIMKNVEVLQVLDQNGNHVFEPFIEENRKPSKIGLLIKDEYIKEINSLGKDNILIVPRESVIE